MRVYVAHKMSGGPGEYLANCARMNRATRALAEAGYDPYNPAADMFTGLASGKVLDVPTYKRVSFAFLEACDLMLVIGELSQGVRDEIDFCEERGIPVLQVPDLDHMPYLYALHIGHWCGRMAATTDVAKRHLDKGHASTGRPEDGAPTPCSDSTCPPGRASSR